MYNHNKAQQSKNRVHISWDILYVEELCHHWFSQQLVARPLPEQVLVYCQLKSPKQTYSHIGIKKWFKRIYLKLSFGKWPSKTHTILQNAMYTQTSRHQTIGGHRDDFNSSPLVPHICVSESGQHFFQIMPCRPFGTKPLSKPMLVIVNWSLRNTLQ